MTFTNRVRAICTKATDGVRERHVGKMYRIQDHCDYSEITSLTDKIGNRAVCNIKWSVYSLGKLTSSIKLPKHFFNSVVVTPIAVELSQKKSHSSGTSFFYITITCMNMQEDKNLLFDNRIVCEIIVDTRTSNRFRANTINESHHQIGDYINTVFSDV